ncbi:hypothetical protein NC651_023682 [Populus alba x Populus x berolinensis]|nr:hypothetical protein NC651_023682 [Populus alba x Populus x berolinensis]
MGVFKAHAFCKREWMMVICLFHPGLAIWRKWLPSQSGNHLNCCLSVVKDFKFDNLNEKVDGASAVIFLVSESIPWNIQKIRLRKLLAYIPSGSKLPLLVLSGSNYEEDLDLSSIIVNELDLLDIDKSQISSFSIVFLIEDKQVEMWDGFFSDMRLREGLRWLANESPRQPDVHCVKTRDLVLTHLNPLLDVLENMRDNEVQILFNEIEDLRSQLENCFVTYLTELSASRIPYELQLEGGGSSPYLIEPTLDELIDAGCSLFMSGRYQGHAETFQPPPRTISNGDVCKDTNTSDLVDNRRTSAQNGNLFETENIDPHEPYKSNTVDAITIKTSWSKCIIQLLHYLYKSTVHRDIRKACGITIDIQKSKLQEVEAGHPEIKPET